MAKKNEPRKQWQDMTYRELDYKALIEHAVSLGKEKGTEALTFLQAKRNEVIPITDEMRQARREELRKLKRREKQGDKTVEVDEPRYTDEEIETLIKEMKPHRKYGALELKKMYCEKFYRSIIPPKRSTDAFDDEIAKALAQLQAGN